MIERYDAIIIGTGQAGPALAQRFDKSGMSVAIVERNNFGGTCVNTGCIPTKTLVASAKVAEMARRADEYGVVVRGRVRVDMKRVKARKDAIVALSRVGVKDWMSGLPNGHVFEGHGHFVSPAVVRVGTDELTSERIFVNTGGRAYVPEIPGLSDVPYLTNSTIMDLSVVPEHLIVLGGSYIGLEFAQAYRRFGAEVTVIELADRLIPREDEDVSDAVRAILEAEGIAVRVGVKCLSVGSLRGQIAVNIVCPEGGPRVVGSHLLIAVGRRPNTDDLGLDHAGVATDEKGYIVVDDFCRTNVKGIWALGDVNGRGAFTHTSYNDYEVVAANIFDADARRISDRIPCYGLFIDPPLGRVGLTESEVRRSGRKALVAKRPMTTVGRARERGETLGFMKVVVDAETRDILGAAILGLNGDEVVQTLLDAISSGASATTIARTMHIHPTVSEYLPTLMGELKPLM
jgi:pyruvate/2-oxoglutarate dehydrogenase complex dihydrolipoamide dehydrogenase (E3) component